MGPTNRERADPTLLAAGGLVGGALVLCAPWAFLLSAAAILATAFVSRAASATCIWIAAAAIAAGALRAQMAVARFDEECAAVDAALGPPSRCSAHARVTASPVRVRGVLRWDADLDRVECADAGGFGQARATLYGGPDDLARGDEAEVVATLAAPQRFWNEATGDPRPGQSRRGIVRSGGALDVHVTRRGRGVGAWIDRARARVRGRIEATFGPDIAPMARALVLGESDLAPDDDVAFRGSGLSHLLAVSGMHLVLVLAFATRGLEALLCRVERLAARMDVGRVAAAAGVGLTWVYADFAGAGGSTERAAWMMTAALVARATGRRAEPVRAFGLSIGAMAIADPLVAFDLSFALSAGATAGLLAFAKPLAEWLSLRLPKFGQALAQPVATTVAASLPCAPMLARFAPTWPIGGVVANLVAVPLGESVALPLCLVHALLSPWPAAERGAAIVASGALVVVRWVARTFAARALGAEVPMPTAWQLAVLAVAFAAWLLRVRRRSAVLAVAAAALCGLEVAARRAGVPHGVLRATFLDVGQGDAAIVDLPNGEALVIDGGGLVGSPIDVGLRVLAPELRMRRRRDLAAVVLSHPHPDHFGGLATGLSATVVRALWDTGQGESEQVGGGYAALLDEMRVRAVPVQRLDRLCGESVIGGARVEVLAPCPRFSSDRGPNDNSIVLRISYGSRALLFVGDAEHEEEAALLATARRELRADVLKVGHHGSRTSSSPVFLQAVAPSHAIVSVGSRNRFGHPNAGTLAALAAAGARVWRTDRDGAVTVTTDGRSLDVRAVAIAR